MSIYEELLSNKCTHCLEQNIRNGNHIDIKWRDEKNKGYWPKPYQAFGLKPDTVKAIVVGQDPTIEDARPLEYALEADMEKSRLGKFLREVFGCLPGIRLKELYFTNLIKCRFDKKPSKASRSISRFFDLMASECYSRFLNREIRQCRNAKYIFTLGRDNFSVLAKLLGVQTPALSDFKKFYGSKMDIPITAIGRICYLVPLPHQPTYDLAQRYSPYSKNEVRKRIERLR
jgi:uracil-DNA glycosylase